MIEEKGGIGIHILGRGEGRKKSRVANKRKAVQG